MLVACSLFATGADLTDAPKPPAGFPRFKVQEIDSGLKIGYAVVTVDIDGDGKLDIVVADQHKIVWYQNPIWKKRVLLDGKTKPDNVCIAAIDIDGDKLPELVVGAGWKPFDTKNAGTLQWLKRGKSLDDEWSVHAIPCDEPMVHRVKVADFDGDGKLEIIMAPLMGRDATKEKNWMDGRPVRILAYPIPKDPTDAKAWRSELISDDLHVVHNLDVTATPRMYKTGDVVEYEMFAASYEGITHFIPRTKNPRFAGIGSALERTRSGDQSNPKGSRGSSEVTAVRMKSWPEFNWVAAVEPWHGNSVAFYEATGYQGADSPKGIRRTVVDDHLRWGHAIKFVDLDADDVQELIVGTRDNPDPKQGDSFTEKRGVRIYRHDAKTKKWERYILEDGGVAVEDLAVADLNGDGKPDIIAVGRATGNCRIYWNQGVAK